MAHERSAAAVSAVEHLRNATRADHEMVDAAFGGYALDTPDGYRDFLVAHARILPLAERLIDPAKLIDGWRGRTAALLADVRAMGGAPPRELEFALPEGDAARWGALYVIEGSRLGGAVLARRVPDGLPAAYLGARHAPGAWRSLLASLESAIGTRHAEAEAGAKAMFRAYREAARP